MHGQPAPILQDSIPDAQRAAAARPLPQMRPIDGPWITRDRAFEAQLAEKARLVATRPDDVIACLPGAEAACIEALELVCAALDLAPTAAMRKRPLVAMSQMIQEDICILQKRGDAHVLTAALLCFPAGWTLSEKLGRRLDTIHAPVPDYDEQIAKRVQRLFDGVRPGRPVWRANLLEYADPVLFAPRRETDPRDKGKGPFPFERSERQTVLRLQRSDAVVFAIHTCVVPR